MASIGYKFNIAIGSTINATDPTVNPNAAPESTPRQGGFTLRNRINMSELSAANRRLWKPTVITASQATSAMLILSVPERTFVRNVSLHAGPGQATAPTTAYSNITSVGSAADSFASGAQLQIGGAFWKKTKYTAWSSAHQSSLSSNAVIYTADGRNAISSIDGCLFGQQAILKEAGTTASLAAKVSATSSTPYAGGIMFQMPGATEVMRSRGAYFPYGGFVTLQMGPHGVATSTVSNSNSLIVPYASSSGTSFTLSGVWDFMAEAHYMPE